LYHVRRERPVTVLTATCLTPDLSPTQTKPPIPPPKNWKISATGLVESRRVFHKGGKYWSTKLRVFLMRIDFAAPAPDEPTGGLHDSRYKTKGNIEKKKNKRTK